MNVSEYTFAISRADVGVVVNEKTQLFAYSWNESQETVVCIRIMDKNNMRLYQFMKMEWTLIENEDMFPNLVDGTPLRMQWTKPVSIQ